MKSLRAHLCCLSRLMGSLTEFIAVPTVVNHSYINSLAKWCFRQFSPFFAPIPSNPCITALIDNESIIIIFLWEKKVGINMNSPQNFFHSVTPRKGNTAKWTAPSEWRLPETYPSNSEALDWSIQSIFSYYQASHCSQIFALITSSSCKIFYSG